MTGILATIKKTIGIAQEDTSFDEDLILYINATMLILSQLGLKEVDASPPINSETTWTDLLGERKDLEVVKTYIHLHCCNTCFFFAIDNGPLNWCCTS